MDNLKNQIINKIISIISPLRDTKKEEIDIITNDLINGNTTSLHAFINNNYSNLTYRKEIKDFINKLVNNNLLDTSYKDIVKNDFEFTNLIVNNILEIGSKPLNVQEKVLQKIEENTPRPKIKIINHEFTEIKFDDLTNFDNIDSNSSNIENNNLIQSFDEFNIKNNDINTFNENKDRNIESENDYFISHNESFNLDLDNNQNSLKNQQIEKNISNENEISNNTNTTKNLNETNINDLRKKILDAQLNYINNATNFINDLEKEDAEDIYNSLIDLNDLRYIQHSLSKLSKSTLERMLDFTQDKLNKNTHSSIDMFMLSAIKKYLH